MLLLKDYAIKNFVKKGCLLRCSKTDSALCGIQGNPFEFRCQSGQSFPEYIRFLAQENACFQEILDRLLPLLP